MPKKILGCIVLIILARFSPDQAFAQTSIKTEMDWGTGRLSVLATHALGPNILPKTHPRTLAVLERELPALLMEDIGNLPWDRFGNLEEYIKRVQSSMNSVEKLAESLNRKWSRISENRSFLEAFYTLDLAKLLPKFFPVTDRLNLPRAPVGWVPTPKNDWTGIVIYVSENTRVWGTGISSPPRPALYARILSDDLTVLSDPTRSEENFLSYHSVANRNKIDSIVGRRPYRTMAQGLYGEFPCDIVLSNADVKHILAEDSGREALLTGKIVILLDSFPK